MPGRSIMGGSVQQKIRLANAIFAVVGGLAIVFWLNRYDWPLTVYMTVIVATLLATSAMEVAAKGQDRKIINGPEDMDRPGGPYDHLHGRK